MKLEQQVCTLDQAKRLKELGVIQNSLWHWIYPEKETVLSSMQGIYHRSLVVEMLSDANEDGEDNQFPHLNASAFTVSELGVMLPRYYPSWRFLEEGGQNELWIATIIGQPQGFERDKEDVYDIRTVAAFDRYGKTQAEALANLLISLLETKTIKAEEVNKRLQQ